MASITAVLTTNTPNEGRIQWNANISGINNEVIGISNTIGAVGGSIVGTTATQILTNKTLISTNRGGTNAMNVSRRDLETASLFLVTSDAGSVSDIDVTQASQYSLQLLGDNGIDTYVNSNILYIKNSEICILSGIGQVFGVNVASVTSGNVAEFGGNVLINNFLAVGDGHTAAGSAEVHIKSDTPELRIEATGAGVETYLVFTDGASNFTLTGELNSEYLELRHDGTRIVNFRDDTTTLDSNITFAKVGGSHLIIGDLEIQGTLTAGGLVATATDVIINNGPVTISGGWSYIADGAIAHDKLALMSSGYILIGAGSGVPTSYPISGDVSLGYTGTVTIQPGVVTLAKMVSQGNTTFLSGTGTGVAAKTVHSNSDIELVTADATTFTLGIKSGVIMNADINASASIDMSKTAFNVNVSGLIMNGNTLEFDSSVKADILYRYVPPGTIITYGGDLGTLSSGNLEEPIPGWFFCNGATYSTGNYPELHSAIGSSWGGSGQLPDLMGVFLRGLDPSNLVDPDTGRTVGSLQAEDFKAHTHEMAYHWAANVETGGGYIAGFKNPAAGYPSTQASGGDETRPVNRAIYYLIKY
jgi:hypothetical protein